MSLMDKIILRAQQNGVAVLRADVQRLVVLDGLLHIVERILAEIGDVRRGHVTAPLCT